MTRDELRVHAVRIVEKTTAEQGVPRYLPEGSYPMGLIAQVMDELDQLEPKERAS